MDCGLHSLLLGTDGWKCFVRGFPRDGGGEDLISLEARWGFIICAMEAVN